MASRGIRTLKYAASVVGKGAACDFRAETSPDPNMDYDPQ